MPTHIEISDKASGEGYQAQVAKYQNSYRLEPHNVFKLEPVAKLVEAIMNENLENFSYDSKECLKVCVDTAAEIRRKIQALQFDRYRIIVVVTIMEKSSQSLDSKVGFLWDSQKDNYTTYTIEGSTFFAYCCVYAVYYE